MHHGHKVGSFTFVRRGAQANQIRVGVLMGICMHHGHQVGRLDRVGVIACTTATKQAALLLLGAELRPIGQSRSIQGYLHAPRPPSRPIRQSRSDCMHYGHQVGSFTFVRRGAQADQIRVGAFRGICMHHGHEVGRLDRVGVIACITATKQAALLLLGAELRPIRQRGVLMGICMHRGHQVGRLDRVGVIACTTATKQAALPLLGAELRPIRQSRSVQGFLHAPRPPSRPIRQSRSDCMHYGHQVGSFTFVRRGAQADQINQERLGVFACTTATKQADQIEQE